MMKLRYFFSTFAALIPALAQASPSFDFNFVIQDHHFHLEIKQEFKRPLLDVQKKLNPTYLPEVSNIVKSVEISTLKDSSTKVSITSSKYTQSSAIVSICSELKTSTEWAKNCSLDLENGETRNYFNSGTENIHCTASSPTITNCTFSIDASVKPQRFLIVNRSPQVLSLGGIVERIHDQAVIARVLNLNETPNEAKSRFEESNAGTCLNQIYNSYQGSAQKQTFNQQRLEVQSSYWRCNP